MKQSIYVAMEMQTGTEKLAEALVLRGFPVTVKDDFITVPNGSQHDYQQLKMFLEKLNIPVFWNDDRFQLLTNHFPLQKMKEVIHFSGHEHFVHMEGYHFKWRSFVNRRYGIRTNTINLCPYTAILVKALNEAGVVTLSGCNGHGKHSPNFQLSGTYNGIWFSIVQQKFLKNLSLNYKWKVQFLPGACNSVVIANKLADECWDMKKVLADCFAMANILSKNAAEIRDWKKQTFKRNMKQTAECFREKGEIHHLYNWMKNKADGNATNFLQIEEGVR